MKRKSIMIAIAMMFLISPALACTDLREGANPTTVGDYTYKIDNKNFVVYDINNEEVGRFTGDSKMYEIVISGNYAYVAGGSTGLIVIDITDPSRPLFVGSFDDNFDAKHISIYMDGKNQYVDTSDDRGNIDTINVNNPASPFLVACIEGKPATISDIIKTFLSWDKTDLLDNGTLSSELSSTMAANAYDNDVPMGIVKFYNPEEQVGYYFAYTVDEAGEITYIDAENDMVYTSMETAKQRLAYRGIDFTNVIYSEYFPDLDVIDGTMDNTIPSNIIVN